MLKKQSVRSLWLLLLLLVSGGCGVTGPELNCDSRMEEYRVKWGDPEEVNRYVSRRLHVVSWWYWSRGFTTDFIWGNDVTGCEVTTSVFSPIG